MNAASLLEFDSKMVIGERNQLVMLNGRATLVVTSHVWLILVLDQTIHHISCSSCLQLSLHINMFNSNGCTTKYFPLLYDRVDVDLFKIIRRRGQTNYYCCYFLGILCIQQLWKLVSKRWFYLVL